MEPQFTDPGIEGRIVGRNKEPGLPLTALILMSCITWGKSPRFFLCHLYSFQKKYALEREMRETGHVPDIFGCLAHWWGAVQRPGNFFFFFFSNNDHHFEHLL